jgi:hypothetical protein
LKNAFLQFPKDLEIPLIFIHRLCLDEIDINSTEAMLFTHPSISPDIAVPLGVNTKREQKVKECSKPLKLYSKEFGQFR